MFEQLNKQLTEQKQLLLDKCTKKLIEYIGIKIPENPSNFEIIMFLDDLRRNGYKIKHEFTNSKDKILLIRYGDLNEEIVSGFEILVKAEDMKVSIIAKPIVLDN